MTQLANRRAFDDEAARRLNEFKRYGHAASVIILDVDHFKKFNDTYGHQAGDAVLRGVAKVVSQAMRDVDLVARYGGEEFAVILPKTGILEALPAAERARSILEDARFSYDGLSLHVTASLGAAQLMPGEDFVSAIRRADEALYAAKQAGRNRVYWHDGEAILPLSEAQLTDGKVLEEEPAVAESPEPAKEPATSNSPQKTEAATAQKLPATSSLSRPAGTTKDVLQVFSTAAVFDADIDRRLAEWRRGGASICVLLVEIDGFDSLAEQHGDEAMQTVRRVVGQLIKATMRIMDHASCYSSSQFALLLPGTKFTDAAVIGERLRCAAAKCRLAAGDESLQFTLALGVARGQEGDDSGKVMSRCSYALEQSRESGGNMTHIHSGEKSIPVDISELAPVS